VKNARTISLKTTGATVQSVLLMRLAFLLNVLLVMKKRLYNSTKMNLISSKYATMIRLKTAWFKLNNSAINVKMDFTLMALNAQIVKLKTVFDVKLAMRIT